MEGPGIESNGRFEVGTRLVEPTGLEIHSAPIHKEDVAKVGVRAQLESMAVVFFGGREKLGGRELPLGRVRRAVRDLEQRPISFRARYQGTEEVQSQQFGGGADARIDTGLGLAESLGVEIVDGDHEMSAQLVGVEPDRGQGLTLRTFEPFVQEPKEQVLGRASAHGSRSLINRVE